MVKTKLARISIDLDEILKEVSKMNGISFSQSSKELADLHKRMMKNKKIIKEIKF